MNKGWELELGNFQGSRIGRDSRVVESYVKSCKFLDPVCTAPNPHGRDIKLNSSTTSVALTLTIVLQNLTTSSHRKKW